MSIRKMLKTGLRNDISAVCFLLLLYFLQGVPLGLGASIPLLLQKSGVSYAQQAVFTFAGYPFSFKVGLLFFVIQRRLVLMGWTCRLAVYSSHWSPQIVAFPRSATYRSISPFSLQSNRLLP